MGIFPELKWQRFFSRLDDKIESEKDEVEMGEFVQSVNGIITILKDNDQERYLLSENVLIYDAEGKEILLSDLKVGVKLQLEFFDHKVVYIEIIEKETDKILRIYNGEVSKVVKATTESLLTILVDDVEKTFVIGEETEIKKEGQTGTLQVDDIKIGDLVKITEITEGDRVMVKEIEIQVSEPVISVYEGQVYSLTQTTTDKLITIYKEDQGRTFVISDETVIKIEGKTEEVSVSDIKIGDMVKIIEIEDDDSVKVTEIEIQVEEPVTKVYEGLVISLAETSTEKLVTIRIGNVDKTFVMDEAVVVKKRGLKRNGDN